MTMPSKIWICPDTMSEMGSAVQDNPPAEGYPEHSYIRKDLADELARALEVLLGGYDYHEDAEAILTRYNEATR